MNRDLVWFVTTNLGLYHFLICHRRRSNRLLRPHLNPKQEQQRRNQRDLVQIRRQEGRLETQMRPLVQVEITMDLYEERILEGFP